MFAFYFIYLFFIVYSSVLFIRRMVPDFHYVLKYCLENTGDFPVLSLLGDRMYLGAGYLFWSISNLLAFVGIG